jgi:hypothetical protein
MALKQRRFLVINYWVGTPTSGALVGPVLVSTSDYRHFHFWDELDAVTLELCDYEIIKMYPHGCNFNQAESLFVREFQSGMAAEWMLLDPAAPALLWAGLGQHFGQPCLAA